MIVQKGRVIDQNIEPPAFAFDPFKQTPHLLVIGVITGDGDAFAAQRVDLARGRVDRTWQRRVALVLRAAGHINRRAFRAERQCNAFAGTARRACHHRDPIAVSVIHWRTPVLRTE
ncbi:hypothetical protein D3C80_1120340 [compost metagenome]